MSWRDDPVLSPDIAAVRSVESGGSESAVSPKGARGSMQVLDTTNTKPGFGVVPARDNTPEERKRVGEDYLSTLQQKYGREDGLRAYNMGPGNYEKWVAGGRKNLNAETAAYVPKVNAAGGTKVSWRDDPLDTPTPQGGASQIPNENAGAPPTPPEPPSFLTKAKNAVVGYGKQVAKEASTAEGWKNAAKGLAGSVVDAPLAIGAGAGKLWAPVVGAAQDVWNKDPLGTGNKRIQESIGQLEQEHAYNPEAPGYKATQIATDVAGTGPAITRLARVPQGASLLTRTGADIAANAGYSGGRAALEGKGITDVMSEAGMGAAGAGIGHGITGIVGGAKAALPEARRLLVNRGGLPSAGQIFGGPAEALERGFATSPVLGQALGARKGVVDAQKTFSTADVNRALEPTGFRVRSEGETAVKEAVDHANGIFADTVDRTTLRTSDARKAVNDGLVNIFGNRTPSSGTRRYEAYQIIRDETHDLTRLGSFPTGRQVKNVDERLGQLVQDYRMTDPQMSRAIRTVQMNLRNALRPAPGESPDVVNRLMAANRARASLYDLEDAAKSASDRGGRFTATESFDAQASHNRRAPVDDTMNADARATDLRLRESGSDNNRTNKAVGLAVAGSGTGLLHGKQMWQGLTTLDPSAVVSATGLAGGAALGHIANSRMGRRAMLEGLAGGLPRDSALRRLLQSQQFAQTGAQVGREAATN